MTTLRKRWSQRIDDSYGDAQYMVVLKIIDIAKSRKKKQISLDSTNTFMTTITQLANDGYRCVYKKAEKKIIVHF